MRKRKSILTLLQSFVGYPAFVMEPVIASFHPLISFTASPATVVSTTDAGGTAIAAAAVTAACSTNSPNPLQCVL